MRHMAEVLHHHGSTNGSHCHINYVKHHVEEFSRVGLFAMRRVYSPSWSTSQGFFGAAVKVGTGTGMAAWMHGSI